MRHSPLLAFALLTMPGPEAQAQRASNPRDEVGLLAGPSSYDLSRTTPPPQAGALDRAAWLQGCWQGRRADRIIDEVWLPPRAHSMINIGRTTRGDSLLEYEIVVLRERGGSLLYEAHPSGQPAAEFPALLVSDTALVFENPAHDFPQRVGYRRNRSDSLYAWIEGTLASGTRRVNFPYARVACPASAGQPPG